MNETKVGEQTESPHGPAFRLGQCDVIGYIESMNQYGRTT